MPKSMPSPKGSNHAGLFVADAFPTPTPSAAYDAASGLQDDSRTKVCEFLQGKLSEEDMAQLKAIMNGGDMAADEPDDFPSKPTDPADNTKIAQDSRRRAAPRIPTTAERDSFNARFPMATRIGHK